MLPCRRPDPIPPNLCVIPLAVSSPHYLDAFLDFSRISAGAVSAQHELDHIGRNRKLAPELADEILAHHVAESLFIGHFATLSQALTRTSNVL